MCTSSCPTPGAHDSWGDCVRAKGLQIGDVAGRATNLRGETELQAYADARAQGIQPKGTSMRQVRAAVDASEKAGVAYRA